ncbi:MAG: outer membrane lipoprotein chaperone LolA [Succinivibrionaceae bacterium]|nr:outer membrane lipoprotein chaperone LolA [Succinivibrionaceae bacterium]
MSKARTLVALLMAGALSMSTAARADAKLDLKGIFSGMTGFSAAFSQKVRKPDGTLLAESWGSVALRRPQDFMLRTREPDEQYVFTRNGKVRSYDPFVNQVTSIPREDLANSPFYLLIAGDDPAVWDRYTVSGSVRDYYLENQSGSDIKAFSLHFNDENYLEVVKLTMRDGNFNEYHLSQQTFYVTDRDFELEIPKDAKLDDR